MALFMASSSVSPAGLFGFGNLELNLQIGGNAQNFLLSYYADGTTNITTGKVLQRGWAGLAVRSSGAQIGLLTPVARVWQPNQTVHAGSPTGGVIGSANGYWPVTAAINEVLIYDHGFLDAELTALESYFRARYGLPTSYTDNVVCDGDSLTWGYQSTDGFNYPNQLGLPAGVCVYNEGVGSETLQTMLANAPANIDAVYDGTKARNVVVIWGGTNDLYSGDTVDNVYGYLQSYCAARSAVGWKVVAVTMMQRSASQTVENDAPGLQQPDPGGLAVVRRWARRCRCRRAPLGFITPHISRCTHLTNLGYGVAAGIIRSAIADPALASSFRRMDQIYKLQPHRTLSLQGFDDYGAAAALWGASDTGFTVSGVFRDLADFAVLVLFQKDDPFGHPLFSYLPDGDLTGLVLDFDVTWQGIQSWESRKNAWTDLELARLLRQWVGSIVRTVVWHDRHYDHLQHD